ncbi:glycosyltransferase [Schaedlerella arabinosiphila]|uniref:Glycosyltransferase n=2 Tax=Schaedlerella arabinosiphila TaxID=2044587 RepID=A0A3R8L252_9FIRM|nr:glycosyltransferase [Schaedlerella arabinosiphila]
MQKIIAIITVYYPHSENVENIASIASQADMTFVVDNSKQDNSNMFTGMNIIYHSMGYNSGIAKAFNYYLKNSNYRFNLDDYIIFFDQDSKISDEHIRKLVKIYEFTKRKYSNLGCIGPIYYNTSNNTYEIPHIKRRLNKYCYSVTDLITSSMLCEYGKLKSVGYWNEDLFLDGADWDLCWRLKKGGMLCCLTDYVSYRHSVGIGEKKILGISMRKNNLNRSYYRTRDSLYLLHREYTPLRIRIRLLIDASFINFFRIIFLDNRRERCCLMIKGYKDYNSKITGELRT